VEALVKSTALQPQLKEEADLELQTAQAALQTARAQVMTKIERYEAAKRERSVAASKVLVAESELHKVDVLARESTIRAPFPSVITKRWVNSGDTIRDAAMPLLTVQRTDLLRDLLRVLIDIPERDVPFITQDEEEGPGSKGNAVEIRIPALENQGEDKYLGTITRKADALDPVTLTMRAEVHLDNKRIDKNNNHKLDKKGLLKPSMTGSAVVTLGTRTAHTVPSTALLRRGDKVEVFYVADPSGDPPRGVARRIEVEVGLDDGKRVEIRSGLTGKELIIAKGNGVVREGDTVIAVSPQEP
jgi:RND family efflux transporter MFP subunit